MRILLSSVEHKGTLTQCQGIAARIAELAAGHGINLTVAQAALFDRLRSRLGPLSRIGAPDVLLSCGTVGERRARKFFERGDRALWAHVEVPAEDARRPDLVFVSRHDWEDRFSAIPGFIPLHGVPHEVRVERVAAQRKEARGKLGLSSQRAVACLIGGPSPAFRFDGETVAAVIAAVQTVAERGLAPLVSSSRRTAPEMLEALRGMRLPGMRLFDGRGANPYENFLAAADAFLVTEDSITMTCEALATGKPVRLLRLGAVNGARLEKFRRFQNYFIEDLACLAFFDGEFERVLRPPPDDTGFAAETIFRAWRERQGA